MPDAPEKFCYSVCCYTWKVSAAGRSTVHDFTLDMLDY